MPGRRQHAEGSLYQRSSDGRWIAVVHLGWKGGKRQRRVFTGKTPDAAVERRGRFLAARRDGFTLPKGQQPSVADWMLHWLHNIARGQVEPTTWHKSYRQKVTGLICPYFERVPLAGLDEEMIERWHRALAETVSERTGRPLSAATITQAHRILSAGLNVAVARKRMPRNPCSNRTVSPPRAGPAEIQPPGDDEVRAILRACAGRRTGARWVTGIATGQRQGETLGMLWPLVHADDVTDASVDVEWVLARLPWEHGCEDPHACGYRDRVDRGHISPCPDPCPRIRAAARPHKCIRPGDPRCCPPDCTGHARECPARRRGGLRLKRPKSARSRASIPLAPYAAAALRQWRTEQKAERLAWGEGWGGWEHDPGSCAGRPRPRDLVCTACALPARPGLLVWTQPGGMPVDPRRDWQDWSDLLESAGLEHYRVHDSRHGLATMLLEEGMDIRVVQEIMRHSTPDFTRRQYQHVRQGLRRDAAAAIERRLGGL